jgi:diadenosine tetraphosphate (Ap4A) HIT family hydrolase
MTGAMLLPETIVEEGDRWTIAVNRNQNLLGKTMLVLRRRCTAVAELDADEWGSLHPELSRVAHALSALYRPDQFNFAFLMNEDAQVHLHVLPRYARPRHWSGQDFHDPHWGRAPGHEQRLLDAHDLARLGSEIRAQLTPGHRR